MGVLKAVSLNLLRLLSFQVPLFEIVFIGTWPPALLSCITPLIQIQIISIKVSLRQGLHYGQKVTESAAAKLKLIDNSHLGN